MKLPTDNCNEPRQASTVEGKVPRTLAEVPGDHDSPGRQGQPTRTRTRRAHRRPMSDRQRRILAFMREFVARNPYPPTFREITRACGIGSLSVTHYNVRILVELGYLARIPGTARGIIVRHTGD